MELDYSILQIRGLPNLDELELPDSVKNSEAISELIDLTEFLKLNTSLIDENIGICYHKLNQFNEAYPYLKSAFEANPKIKGNLYNFISVCANLDKKEDAKIAIEKYKNAGNDISNDEMIQVALKWIK